MTDLDGSSSQKLLEEIKTLFDKAEGCMKSLEHVDGLFVPTVNQLRYAGRHIVDYLAKPEHPISDLEKAKRHCQRAIYDASDAHIQWHIQEVDGFEDDFANVVITDVYSEFPRLVRAKQAAVRFLERGRASESTREDMYEECIHHREELENLVAELPIFRNELNKKVIERRRAGQVAWISSLVGIAGAITGLVSLL